MEVLNAFVSLDPLEDQNRYFWTTFQTIEIGWDLDFFVECNLFEFYAKCGRIKLWRNDYSLFFGSNLYLWMRKHNIVVIFLRFDFEGEMCRIMCTRKRMCLKEIWVEFWCFIEASFNIFLDVFLKLFHLFFQDITFSYCIFSML